MNRAFVIILTLLFLWSGAADGTFALCCCKTEMSSLMDGPNNGRGSDTEAFFCEGHSCSHHGQHASCSFQCAKEPFVAGFSTFESLLSDHQISTFPSTLLHSENRLQTKWPISGQVCSFQDKPIDILLQTCSLLS